MRIVPADDDSDDDGNEYTDVRHLHLEPIIGARCGCAACRMPHDLVRDGRTLPRPLQTAGRRRNGPRGLYRRRKRPSL